MNRKNNLTIAGSPFAFDSVTAATNVMRALEKAIRVEWNYEPDGDSYYEPQEMRHSTTRLELNQLFKPLRPTSKATAKLSDSAFCHGLAAGTRDGIRNALPTGNFLG